MRYIAINIIDNTPKKELTIKELENKIANKNIEYCSMAIKVGMEAALGRMASTNGLYCLIKETAELEKQLKEKKEKLGELR